MTVLNKLRLGMVVRENLVGLRYQVVSFDDNEVHVRRMKLIPMGGVSGVRMEWITESGALLVYLRWAFERAFSEVEGGDNVLR
jgi:hypothetical protein